MLLKKEPKKDRVDPSQMLIMSNLQTIQSPSKLIHQKMNTNRNSNGVKTSRSQGKPIDKKKMKHFTSRRRSNDSVNKTMRLIEKKPSILSE
jgi:hypothetical protein